MSDWGSYRQLDAVVTLADGEVLPGRIHLQGAVGHRQGPESPLEMLNRSEGFFPVTSGEGEVVFLSKAQVATVTCEWEPNPDQEEVEASARHATLLVVMTSGEEFRGDAAIVLPGTRSRALDYVNSLEPFFLLRTAGGPRLINRSHVRLVRPLE